MSEEATAPAEPVAAAPSSDPTPTTPTAAPTAPATVLGTTDTPELPNAGNVVPASEGWAAKAGLPEDLQNDTGLAKYDSVEAAVRAGLSAQKMIGRDLTNMVDIPTDASNIEHLRPVMEKLGLPAEQGDHYNFKAAEGAERHADTPLAKGFATLAHQAGILPHQAQAVFQGFTAMMNEAEGSIEQQEIEQSHADFAAMQKEFGPAFDQTAKNANFAMKQLGLEGVVEKHGLSTNPDFVRALSKMAPFLIEDGSEGASHQLGNAQTPAQITAKASDLNQQAIDLLSTNPEKAKRLMVEAANLTATIS